MSTLRKYQSNPSSLLNNAKMLFDNKGLQTIVVEGESDYRLLRQWLVDENARLENVNGKPNVKEIWLKAKERRFMAVHCIADLDYDIVLKDDPIIDEQFIYVSMLEGSNDNDIECNDLESALIRSRALSKVMSQKYRGAALYENFEERIYDLREKLRVSSLKIGAFRAANQQLWLSKRISAIDGEFRISEEFFDADNFQINGEKLASFVRNSSSLKGYAIEEMISKASQLELKYTAGWQLCRGHDLTELLALHVTNIVERRVSSREIEEDLRMACELEMLSNTRFGSRLLKIGSVSGRPLLKVNDLPS